MRIVELFSHDSIAFTRLPHFHTIGRCLEGNRRAETLKRFE